MDLTWHFRRTADGKRVPLVLRDLRNLYKHIITRLMMKVVGFLNHQMCDLIRHAAILLRKEGARKYLFCKVYRYNIMVFSI